MTVHRRPNIKDFESLRDFLADYVTYLRGSSRNWSYALWAQKLGVSKSSLVMAVSGQRLPSSGLMTKIATGIGMSASERTYLYDLVEKERRSKEQVSRYIFQRGAHEENTTSRRQWLNLVLLELLKEGQLTDDIAEIQRRLILPVSKADIEHALNTLKTEQSESTTEAKKSVTLSEEEIAQFHEDGNKASALALVETERECRVFLTSLLNVAATQLPEIRAILKTAQSQISALAQAQPTTQLYELHLHLFPLTRDKLGSS